MRILFSLLVIISLNSQVYAADLSLEETPLEIKQIIEKEHKIDSCMDDYIKKQSKAYTKIVQNNLYDLIHNFDKVTSRIYGKKSTEDDTAHEEKVEALARIQCEVYHRLGVLR